MSKKSNEVKVYGTKGMPLFLFASQNIPRNIRVLLAYAAMANGKGVSSISIRTLADLIGEPVGEARGKEAQAILNKIRIARRLLKDKGALEMIKGRDDDTGGYRYSYRVVDTGLPDETLARWNRLGAGKKQKVCYTEKAWQTEPEADEPEKADADGQDQLQAWLDAGD